MADSQTPDQRPQTKTPSFLGTASPFRSLHEEMDRMLHAFSLPQMKWNDAMTPADGLGLRVDIAETDAEIQIKADLPGIAEDDVEITLEDNILHLRAEKKHEAETDEQDWKVVERSHGVFERRIHVPEGIDVEKANASFDKGVLTVTLPKPPDAKPASKRIAVTSAN